MWLVTIWSVAWGIGGCVKCEAKNNQKNILRKDEEIFITEVS